jgi:hypothetical protein
VLLEKDAKEELDLVRNEKVLHRVKENRSIIHTIKTRKAD